MDKSLCLDTGPITLYHLKDTPREVSHLMSAIEQGVFTTYIPEIILVEVFYRLCLISGKSFAESSLRSFTNKFPLQILTVPEDIVFKAGELKCRYRDLSYNDCVIAAWAMKLHAQLHTTEKKFPNDLKALRIKTYEF